MNIENQPEVSNFETARQAHERAKIQLADVIQRIGAASMRRVHLVRQHQKLPIIGKIDRVDHSVLLNEAQAEIAQIDAQMVELKAMKFELEQRVKDTEAEQNRAELHELLSAYAEKRANEVDAKRRFAASGLALIDAAEDLLNASIARETSQKRIALLAQVVRRTINVPPVEPAVMPKFSAEWVSTNRKLGRRELQKLAALAR